jgi:hypothetical protein
MVIINRINPKFPYAVLRNESIFGCSIRLVDRDAGKESSFLRIFSGTSSGPSMEIYKPSAKCGAFMSSDIKRIISWIMDGADVEITEGV